MKTLGQILTFIFISFTLSAQTLKVGDAPPLLKDVKWIKGFPVTEFKKGQVYIVEMGATWCVPCGHAIPVLSKIHEKYADENVNVVGVFVMEQNKPDYMKVVEDYVAKRGAGMSYTVAADLPERNIQKTWIEASKAEGVPRTFIIDKNGKIAFILNNYKEIEEKLKQVISDDYDLNVILAANSSVKPPFDYNKLFLLNGNGGPDSAFLFRSVMSIYDGTLRLYTGREIISYFDEKFYPDSIYGERKGRVQEIGVGLDVLYRMAYTDTLTMDYMTRALGTFEYPDTSRFPHTRTVYGKWWPRVVLEVSEPDIFQWDYRYLPNRFNYSLKVPKEVATAKFLKETMQRDLQTYFGYNVSVEIRTMPCWKIVTTPETSQKLKKSSYASAMKHFPTDKGHRYEHAEMRDIVARFEWAFGALSGNKEAIPFIDETGITYNFEYDIYEKEEFVAMHENKDFEAGKRFLNRIGFDIVKSTTPLKVVVIRD